jgi:GntR family transcriptional regulator
MEFKSNEAIYIQIAHYVIEQILLDKWVSDSKILSVRDLAIELQVNPNTVMRSYEYLQNKEIIYNKRGIGFFVSMDAIKRIMQEKRESFLKEELPALFKSMALLNVSIGEITAEYQKFKP